MVTTGTPVSNGYHTEVIDLVNPNNTCTDLADFPIHIYNAVGGLISNKSSLVCGGYSVLEGPQSKCYIIGQTEAETELIQPRQFSSSVVIYNDEVLWVIGGASKSGIILMLLSSTETI